MANRPIKAVFLGDASSLLRENKKVEQSLGRVEGRLESFATKYRTQIQAATAVGVAAFGFLATKGIKAASDLQEAQNKSNEVFGDSSRIVSAFAETSADAFGISQRAANSYAATLGQILQVSGVAQQESADMSVALLSLASDLASFNDIEIDEALEKLRSGLVGEAEPLRTVGVLLSAARVEQEAYASGIAETGSVLTEAQKVQARYNIIMQDTAMAQGDFTRTADSAANASRRLSARAEDQAATIGQKLLPLWQGLQQILLRIPTPVIAVAVALGAVATAMGLVLVALPSLIGGFTLMTAAAGGLGAALGTLGTVTLPLLVGALAVGAVSWVKYNNAQKAAEYQAGLTAKAQELVTTRTLAEIQAQDTAFKAHIAALEAEEASLTKRIQTAGVNSRASAEMRDRLNEVVHELNGARAGAEVWALAVDMASSAQANASATAAGLGGTLNELTGAYRALTGAALAASLAEQLFDISMSEAQEAGVSRIPDLRDEMGRLQGFLNLQANAEAIGNLTDRLLAGQFTGQTHLFPDAAVNGGGFGGGGGGGGVGTASTGRAGTLSAVDVIFKNSRARRFAGGDFLGLDVGAPGAVVRAPKEEGGTPTVIVNVSGSVISDRELRESIVEAINDARAKGINI